MSAETTAPPSGSRGHSYAALDETAFREIVATMVARLERHLEENATREETLRANTETLRAVQDQLAELTGAVLTIGSRVARHSRESRRMAETIARQARERDANMEALQTQLDHNAEQSRKRDSELGARLGAVEADLGEAPNEAAGRPGHGMRQRVAIIYRELQQRKLATPLASLVGGGGVLAIVQVVKLIVESWPK